MYKARCAGSGKIVALKFLTKEGKCEKELQSLRQEIEILRKLDHPNITKMMDTFETEVEVCVVTGVVLFLLSSVRELCEL